MLQLAREQTKQMRVDSRRLCNTRRIVIEAREDCAIGQGGTVVAMWDSLATVVAISSRLLFREGPNTWRLGASGIDMGTEPGRGTGTGGGTVAVG